MAAGATEVADVLSDACFGVLAGQAHNAAMQAVTGCVARVPAGRLAQQSETGSVLGPQIGSYQSSIADVPWCS